MRNNVIDASKKFCFINYSQVALQRGPKFEDITLTITGNEVEYQSDAGLSKDTPYLALTGELWVSFVNVCEKIDRVITEPHCICFGHVRNVWHQTTDIYRLQWNDPISQPEKKYFSIYFSLRKNNVKIINKDQLKFWF